MSSFIPQISVICLLHAGLWDIHRPSSAHRQLGRFHNISCIRTVSPRASLCPPELCHASQPPPLRSCCASQIGSLWPVSHLVIQIQSPKASCWSPSLTSLRPHCFPFPRWLSFLCILIAFSLLLFHAASRSVFELFMCI